MKSKLQCFWRQGEFNEVFIRRRRIKLEIEKGLLNKIHHYSYQELLKKIPDNSIDVLLTDPPYNIAIDGGENGM